MPFTKLLAAFGVVVAFAAMAWPASAQHDYVLAKTPGGLAFYWRRDATTPYAAINFGWRHPYWALNPGKVGASQLATSVILASFDGTPEGPIAERFKDHHGGGTLSSGQYSISGSLRAPAEKLGQVAEIFAEMFTVTLSEKVFQRIKARQTQLAEQVDLNPTTVANRALLQIGFGDDPVIHAWRPDRFRDVWLADIEAWRKAVLRRDGLHIAASGNLAEAEIAAILDKLLGGLPALGAIPAHEVGPVKIKPQTVLIEQQGPQTTIYMAGETRIPQGHDTMFALAGIQVLGGGSDGRLFQKIRSELGATYNIVAGASPSRPDHSPLVITTQVAHDKAAAAIALIKRTQATWRAAGVTADELASVRRRTLSSVAEARRDPSTASARLLGNYLLRGLDVAHAATFDTRYAAMTTDEVNAAIKAQAPDADTMLTIVVAPSAEGFKADCVIKSLAEIDTCR